MEANNYERSPSTMFDVQCTSSMEVGRSDMSSSSERSSTSSSIRAGQKTNDQNTTKKGHSFKFTWTTREVARNLDWESYLKLSLREFFIYTVFLLCLTIVVWGLLSSWTVWYSRLITDLFIRSSFSADPYTNKTFPQIVTPKEFWKYSSIILARNFWYDLYPDDIMEDLPLTERSDMRNVLYENRLIGAPRIRQLKVRSNSCKVHVDLTDLFPECYDTFSEVDEDRNSFGEFTGTAWTYSRDKSRSDYFTGQIASYPGGGFYKDLSLNHDDFITEMNDLKNKGWVTRGTRVIFVDFTLYNANVNLFCFVKLIFEFPPTGGIVPSWQIISLRLIRYVHIVDYVFLIFEILTLLFLVGFSIEETIELRYLGVAQYFSKFWNYIDLFLIMLGWTFLSVYLYKVFINENHIYALVRRKRTFAKFHRLMWTELLLNSLLMVIVMLAWFKLFKYLNFSKTTNRFLMTLYLTRWQLFTVFFLLTIILLGFLISGYLLFGFYILEYIVRLDLNESMAAYMMRYYENTAYSTFLTSVYFVLLFVVTFAFLCSLVAILLDGYFYAGFEDNPYDNYSVILKKHCATLSAYIRNKPFVQREETMSYAKIYDLLRRNNFSNSEIEQFVRKFNLRPTTVLNKQGVDDLIQNIQHEICKKQEQCMRQENIDGTNRQISSLQNSVDSIQCAMDGIISRLSHLQKRLSRIENRLA